MSDANYYDRFAEQKQEQPRKEKERNTLTGETGLSIAKVFGYMFIGLAITAVISLGLAAVFRFVWGINSDQPIDETLAANAAIVLIVLLIVSAISLIVLSIVVPITVARGKSSVMVPAIIYTVLMGIMLSSIAIFVPWYLLGLTFGITALVFGLMALIALLSKSRLNGLAIAAIGLLVGAGILSMVLWIMMLTNVITGNGGYPIWLYWVITLVVFAAIMLITIWDMARIKAIAQKGEMTNNISLYCAFILYNDFINIFLRILRIVLYIFARSRN